MIVLNQVTADKVMMIEYHSVIDITSSLPESKNLCAGVFIDVHLLVIPHRCHDVVIFVPKFIMRAISTAHIILNGYTYVSSISSQNSLDIIYLYLKTFD